MFRPASRRGKNRFCAWPIHAVEKGTSKASPNEPRFHPPPQRSIPQAAGLFIRLRVLHRKGWFAWARAFKTEFFLRFLRIPRADRQSRGRKTRSAMAHLVANIFISVAKQRERRQLGVPPHLPLITVPLGLLSSNPSYEVSAFARLRLRPVRKQMFDATIALGDRAGETESVHGPADAPRCRPSWKLEFRQWRQCVVARAITLLCNEY